MQANSVLQGVTEKEGVIIICVQTTGAENQLKMLGATGSIKNNDGELERTWHTRFLS